MRNILHSYIMYLPVLYRTFTPDGYVNTTSYSLIRRSFHYVYVTRAGNIRRITPIENSVANFAPARRLFRRVAVRQVQCLQSFTFYRLYSCFSVLSRQTGETCLRATGIVVYLPTTCIDLF